MKAIIKARLYECKCEKCDAIAEKDDNFCSKCGHDLKKEITTEIVLEKKSSSLFDNLNENLLSKDEIDALLCRISKGG